MSGVQFHLQSFPFDRWGGVEPIVEAARAADELGFAGIQIPDHVVMPERPDRKQIRRVWYDPLILATHIASHTRRLRLVFNILVVPYRPPVQTAKALATLDVVSGGRVTVGVGTGWNQREFDILGIPLSERGRMTDEHLRIMKDLWTRDEAGFERDGKEFRNFAFEPRCVQKPHIPFWIGGSGPRPMRRVLEHGNGWTPMVGSLDDLKSGVDWLREQLEARGRDPDSLDFCYFVTVGAGDSEIDGARTHASGGEVKATTAGDSPQAVIDSVGQLADIGFRQVTLHFEWQTPADYHRRIEWLAQHVLPAF